ncbi:MAG: hypothetical protein DRO88_05810 [Promethearchaeia archaeon]|nr:MAG: hypothetical protein DRO88_05810 [Candidatus Lokiarchaeia archaeon]
MGRPHKFRKISNVAPKFTDYHPKGIDIQDVDQMFLSMEEFEALRLRYYENLKQTEAAVKMQISQTTFSRILSKAFRKITKALVEGYGIAIQTDIITQPPTYGRGRRRRGRYLGRDGPPLQMRDNLQENSVSQVNSRDFESAINPPQWITPIAEPKKIVFKGWGCLNCGYIFQTQPSINNNEADDSSISKKPKCPKCQSSKTYSLIKKLSPESN